MSERRPRTENGFGDEAAESDVDDGDGQDRETDVSDSDSDEPVFEAYVVVAFTGGRPLADGPRVLLAEADELVIGRGEKRSASVRGREITLTIDDNELLPRHVVLRRGKGVWDPWEVEDLGSTNGTFINSVRVTRTTIVDGDVLEAGSTFIVFRELDMSESKSDD